MWCRCRHYTRYYTDTWCYLAIECRYVGDIDIVLNLVFYVWGMLLPLFMHVMCVCWLSGAWASMTHRGCSGPQSMPAHAICDLMRPTYVTSCDLHIYVTSRDLLVWHIQGGVAVLSQCLHTPHVTCICDLCEVTSCVSAFFWYLGISKIVLTQTSFFL